MREIWVKKSKGGKNGNYEKKKNDNNISFDRNRKYLMLVDIESMEKLKDCNAAA